jgi:hypothetical protein
VFSDRSRHDHRVTRSRVRHAELVGGLDDADAGRVDVAAVALAALDDLGVAGDDRDAGLLGRPRHRRADAGQVGDREALLEDEAGGEVQRAGAGDGEVVDGAVDGEVADVAAGEEQRGDHERVGGQRHPARFDPELGGVLHPVEQRVAERLGEDRLDQGVRGLPAGAVGEGDPLLADLGLPPAGLLDPVQDLLLAVGDVPGGFTAGGGSRRTAHSCAHAGVTSVSATRRRLNRPKL